MVNVMQLMGNVLAKKDTMEMIVEKKYVQMIVMDGLEDHVKLMVFANVIMVILVQAANSKHVKIIVIIKDFVMMEYVYAIKDIVVTLVTFLIQLKIPLVASLNVQKNVLNHVKVKAFHVL